MKVFTAKGLIEFSDLKVLDLIELGDNHRKIVTEYRFHDEVVRQDVVVNVLRPLTAEAQEGALNGQ